MYSLIAESTEASQNTETGLVSDKQQQLNLPDVTTTDILTTKRTIQYGTQSRGQSTTISTIPNAADVKTDSGNARGTNGLTTTSKWRLATYTDTEEKTLPTGLIIGGVLLMIVIMVVLIVYKCHHPT